MEPQPQQHSGADATGRSRRCCRLCLRSCEQTSLLLDAALALKLMAFAAVQIQENDGLPTTICTKCHNNINTSYDFKCQVEKSDHDLRQAFLAKQSTLNTQWPTNPIEKSLENASTVEVIIPTLQNNIINSCMTIQNDYTLNSQEQYAFKVTTANINNDICTKNNEIQQNLVRTQNVIENSDILSFELGNAIPQSQINQTNDAFTETQQEIKKKSNNEITIEKSEIHNTQENANQSDDEKPLILRTKRHKCNYCIKSFANLTLLQKHAIIHKQQKIYVCYLCSKEFTSADETKNHAMKIHGFNADQEKLLDIPSLEQNSIFKNKISDDTEKIEEKTFRKFACKFCNRQFTNQKLFLAHLKCHRNYKEKLLNGMNKNSILGEAACHPTNSETVSYLANIQASYSANSESATHPADLKSASYPVNAEITSQSTNIDINLKKSNCKTKEFPHKDNINKSQINNRGCNNGHYGDNDDNEDDDNDSSQGEDNNSLNANIQCNQCGILVATHRNLRRHLLTHTGFKYNCSICNKDFSRPDKLREHQQMKHKEIFGKLEADNGNSNESNVAVKRKKGKNRPYKCLLCPKAFAQAQSLANHEERHKRVRDVRKRYLCEICSKCFAQSGSLVAHMRTHTGVKPYVCNICSRAFTKSTYLQLHLRTHSGEKPYICQYCNRAFARANTLARHITMHTGEAKYQCQICAKLFRRLTSLNEHMYTHTGQRPYACKICSKRYNNAGSLYAHTKKCKVTHANNNVNNTTDTVEPQPFDDSIIPLSDIDISAPVLILTDKKFDELLTEEVLLAESQTCQFMIANMNSQKPISPNILEQFTFTDSDIYNINSKQLKTPYCGLFPSV